MDYLAELQMAIKQLHGCESSHLQTVPVKETFKGETVWDGEVEVFTLHGHKSAGKCYAWGYLEQATLRVVTVLELPPVVSPATAVRAVIVAGSKK